MSAHMPHRRREQGIVQQLILRKRLNQLGISHVSCFYDMRNAFACPTQNCGGDNDVEKLIMVIMWRSDGWVGEYEN